VDVAVEREGIGYTKGAKDDNELTIREEGYNWDGLKFWEGGTDDIGNGIADDDPEGTHA
jgi:hypothetical protein